MPVIASDAARAARWRWLRWLNWRRWRIASWARGWHGPRWSLRLRLTLLYGGLFLVAGAVLLAITYGLVAHTVPGESKNAFVVQRRDGGPVIAGQRPSEKTAIYISRTQAPLPLPSAGGIAAVKFADRLRAAARTRLDEQQAAELDSLLTLSVLALGVMTFISIGLGWLMAGRALRPIRTMSQRARGISERNLHERLALDGPSDELKELGDTFDDLLGRIESAFESQRRFVANASHELRTPITVERTLVEVALADPHASTASLRATCERVLAAGEQQERLIEALLTLARSQRGLDRRSEVDLGTIAAEVTREVPRDGVRVSGTLGRARAAGDPALVERLVANLVQNAVLHNQPGGWVTVWTGVAEGRARLRISNSGPVVRAEEVGSLVEPFRRLNGERSRHARGLGLGLSIVSAIGLAHGAEVGVARRAGGGLDVEVAFPAV